MKKIGEFVREYGYLAIAAILILILWNALNDFISSKFVPLFSSVEKNNWYIQVGVVILPFLVYLPKWTVLSDSKRFWSHRRLIAIFLVGLYLFFRFSGEYFFYGIYSLPLSYSDSFVLVCFIIELCFALQFICRKRIHSQEAKCIQFYEEQPTKVDMSGRERYVSLLRDKIISSYNQRAVQQGAFTILINERYGTGKTSFMRQLEDRLSEKKITCLSFKPWSADSQEHITSLFLSELSAAIHSYDEDRALSKLINDYSDLITGAPRNVLNLLKKRVTRSTSLSSQFNKITVELKKLERPIVVFIDDVDRLNYLELESVLKLVRDTADFPNLFYIVAADKKVISSTISNSRGGDPEEFFKKFFNFEMLFPADDGYLKTDLHNRLEQILHQYFPGLLAANSILDWFDHYKYFHIVFRNHRDIIRYLNLLSFSLDAVKAYSLVEEFNILDYARLVLLEFLDPEIYKLFRDYPESILLDAAEGKYSFKREFKKAFVDKEFQHQFDDNRAHLIESGKIKPSKDDPKPIEYKNLDEVRKNALPSNDDVIASLIRDLFTDANDRDTTHIYYRFEYYKFFSGHYKKGQFSDSDAQKILCLSEELYLDKISEIVEHDCQDGFIHKVRHLAKCAEWSRLDILKKMVLLLDVYYRQLVQENSVYGIFYEYPKSGIEGVIMGLYMNSPSHQYSATKEEIEAHSSFFNLDKHYLCLGLILKSLYYNDLFDPIFSPKLIFEWRKHLIKRFIKEQLMPFPFKLESLYAIPALERMYEACWADEFEAYVKDNNCAKQWAFSLIKPDGESYIWNRTVYYSISTSEGFLPSWFLQALKNCLPPDIFADMINLGIGDDQSIKDVENHPYLRAAIEWHKTIG